MSSEAEEYDAYAAEGGQRGYEQQEEEADDIPKDQPRILLMGLRKSGKTSIQKVVFEKVSPQETMLLETSAKMSKYNVSKMSFVQFQILDYPGQLMEMALGGEEEDINLSAVLAQSVGAVVFVIDCTDQWPPGDATRNLVQIILRVVENASENKTQKFEVFIHKVDYLKQEQCKERLIMLKLQIEEEFNFAIRDKVQKEQDPTGRLQVLHGGVREWLANNVFYHMTSIFDHSVFDAFSKVVQRVIGNLHHCIQELLGMLVQNSMMEKAYLFDIFSKIYIAQDTNEASDRMYEICFDMIDVATDVSVIYGTDRQQQQPPPRPQLGGGPSSEADDALLDGEDDDPPDGVFAAADSSSGPAAAATHTAADPAPSGWDRGAHDCMASAAVVKLESKQVLYMKEVTECLALVCLLREDSFKKIGLINYNVMQFKKLMKEMFRVHEEHLRPRPPAAVKTT